VPAKGTLVVVRVLAGGRVIAQTALAELKAQERGSADWRGVLYVPIHAFELEDAGELELQMLDGRRFRFVIVGSAFGSQVTIRGFGPPPL
jgi:hypothetical protein